MEKSLFVDDLGSDIYLHTHLVIVSLRIVIADDNNLKKNQLSLVFINSYILSILIEIYVHYISRYYSTYDAIQ